MTVAKQILWMVLGYLVAVLVATIVTVALFFMASVFLDSGQRGSFNRIVNDAASFVFIGSSITVVYAFPGWLISVVIAAYRSILHKRYFIIAGALTALLAHFLMATLSSDGSFLNFKGPLGAVGPCSVIGGAFGGWAYWRVAVRRFGKWRVEA